VLGINSVGIELSYFNWLISKVKTDKYDLEKVGEEIRQCLHLTQAFSYELVNGQTDAFIEPRVGETQSEYLKKWYAPRALAELLFYRDSIQSFKHQDILKIILSRSARSARLITHYDLARPKEPIDPNKQYWCIKHKRWCEPTREAIKFINRYSLDTISRLKEYDDIRTDAKVVVLHGDGRSVNLPKGLKLDGIYTSPPYVGMIDYHDQHKYAYELFGIDRQDELEIGPMSRGRSKAARERYIEEIVNVFANVSHALKKRAHVFIVVNDRFELYPRVARALCWDIVDIYQRPVLMRTERDNSQYFESIYHMRKL